MNTTVQNLRPAAKINISKRIEAIEAALESQRIE